MLKEIIPVTSMIHIPFLKIPGIFLLAGCTLSLYAQIRKSEYSPGHELTLVQKRNLIDSAIKAVYQKREEQPDSAIAELKKIASQCETICYESGRAMSLTRIANIIINIKGEEDVTPALTALRNARRSLFKTSQKDQKLREHWYTNMAAAFAKLAKPDSAMYYYTIALDIGIKRNTGEKADQLALAINYISLASIFLEMQQFGKAIHYARQSAKLSIDNNFYQQLYRSYLQIAGALLETDFGDSAFYYLERCKQVAYQPNEFDQKVLNEYTGNFYLLNNNPQKAVLFFKKAIAINCHASPRCHKGLGIAYKMLKRYREARDHLALAEIQFQETKYSPKALISVYEQLAALQDTLRNYKSAYKYKSIAAALQKQADDTQKIQIVNRLEGAFRKAEQDKQLSENKIQLMTTHARLHKQKIWTMGIVLLVIILSILIVSLYQKQKIQKQKSKTREQQQEIEKLKIAIEAEDKERSRIGRELHDDIMVQLSIVKMNLEGLPATVPELANSNDYVSIKEQLHFAGRALRQTAHNLSPDTLLADGLAQALVYFFKNVQYRTQLNINFQYYGPTTRMRQETEMNLYRIAQELIQNIIKHAKADNVLVQLSYRPGIVTLTVEDDGTGFDMHYATGKIGIGLKSIKSRLKVMNGDIDIHPRHPRGTSVTIEVYL